MALHGIELDTDPDAEEIRPEWPRLAWQESP